MMDFPIEKNIPLPKRPGGRAFHRLPGIKVGEARTIVGSDRTSEQSFRSNLYKWAKRNGQRITTTKLDDNVFRVTRLK